MTNGEKLDEVVPGFTAWYGKSEELMKRLFTKQMLIFAVDTLLIAGPAAFVLMFALGFRLGQINALNESRKEEPSVEP